MQRKLLWILLEGAVILFALIFVFCRQISLIPFHKDESQWIGTSIQFDAYRLGKFNSPVWNVSYWTVTQPPLPRYIIGIGRYLGGYGISTLNTPWDFEKSDAANIMNGALPSDSLLWWSRFPMAVLAGLSFFLVFIILLLFTGRISAYSWIALCLLSAYFPVMLDRAMGEASLLFCTVLLVLLACWKWQAKEDSISPFRMIIFLWFALFGIGIGLAESSKINGLVSIIAGVIIAIIIGMQNTLNRTLKIRFVLIATYILMLSSQITFFILNPFLWKDPLERNRMMLRQRFSEFNTQRILYPSSNIENLSQRIAIIPERIFHTYASIHAEGFLIINILLFLIGLAYLLRRSFLFLRKHDNNATPLAILIVGGVNSIPSLFTPLDWDRYYLFPVFFSSLIISVGFSYLVISSFGWINHKRRRVHDGI